MELRPYQTQAIAQVFDHWKSGIRSVLLQMPTGAGKSATLGKICEIGYRKGRRVIVVAHRTELVEQLKNTLGRYGINAGVIQAGAKDNNCPIKVCSVQTLYQRHEWYLKGEEPNLIIFDEAHHAVSRTYRDIADHYPQAKVLGVTATPCRTDGKPLDDLFEVLVFGPTIPDLINQRYLVPPDYYVSDSVLGDKRPKVLRGDFVLKDLAAVVSETHLEGDLVNEWLRLGEDRQTVVFAVGRDHSLQIVNAYLQAGITAAHIDCHTKQKDRAAILADFAAGKIRILSNVGIVTEGFDVPEIGCVQLARPTQSVALYYQMVGRALRPSEGKKRAIILDHAGAYAEHGSVLDPRHWSLDGEVISKAQSVKKEKAESIPQQQIVRVNGEVLLVPITPDNAPWLDRLNTLLSIHRKWNTNKYGIARQLKEEFPNLTVDNWKVVAKALGYKWQWAKHIAEAS